MKQLHQSQQNEKHYNYQVPESGTRLFLYLIKSKLDTSYTRTYLLMRKQCLMFMLLLAASERAEKNPLKIKFRKDIVETYKPIV